MYSLRTISKDGEEFNVRLGVWYTKITDHNQVGIAIDEHRISHDPNKEALVVIISPGHNEALTDVYKSAFIVTENGSTYERIL